MGPNEQDGAKPCEVLQRIEHLSLDVGGNTRAALCLGDLFWAIRGLLSAMAVLWPIVSGMTRMVVPCLFYAAGIRLRSSHDYG